jgi:signal transduction histidine kinase
MASLKAGRAKLETEDFPAWEVCRGAMDAGAKAAAVREINLRGEDPNASITAHGDPDRVGSVLGQLLNHAFALLPRGGDVSVSVREQNGFALFCVATSLPTVSVDGVPRVFDHASEFAAALPGAGGLDMHVAREIIRAHGGKMGCRTVDGEGSEYFFTIPLGKGSA